MAMKGTERVASCTSTCIMMSDVILARCETWMMGAPSGSPLFGASLPSNVTEPVLSASSIDRSCRI
jgi:hypothetical protein